MATGLSSAPLRLPSVKDVPELDNLRRVYISRVHYFDGFAMVPVFQPFVNVVTVFDCGVVRELSTLS